MDWVTDIKARETAAGTAEEAKALRQANTVLLLKAKAPLFFQDLIDQIDLAVAALNPETRHGSVTRTGSPDYEQGARIHMMRVGFAAKDTYTTMHYLKDQSFIQCTTVEGGSFRLHFRVNDENEVLVKASADMQSMDHRQAARFIVEPMMKKTS